MQKHTTSYSLILITSADENTTNKQIISQTRRQELGDIVNSRCYFIRKQ